MTITIHADTADTKAFLVRITGQLQSRRSLHAALGNRLADALQDHFRARNAEPNRMQAPKTNYWNQLAEATQVTSVTDEQAVVSIADARFRIQLFGGTIRPTGGRRFLTIPLVPQARGRRVAEYEKATGHKLFRLPNTGVLVERTDMNGSPDRFAARRTTGVIRGKTGFRTIGIGGGSLLRTVYALKTSVTVPRDPEAMPAQTELVAALQDEANDWISRQTTTET